MACSKPLDTLAEHESEKSTSGFATHRLEGQETIRFTPNLGEGRMARLRFAYHDGEEVGPHSLARMGRRTGLIPDGL